MHPSRRLLFSLGLLLPASLACNSAGDSAQQADTDVAEVEYEIFSEPDFDAHSRQVVERDAFPVLDEPTLLAATDDSLEMLPDEPVIGIHLGGEARAYPLSVMGGHELVNDVCGGLPVAVSW